MTIDQCVAFFGGGGLLTQIPLAFLGGGLFAYAFCMVIEARELRRIGREDAR